MATDFLNYYSRNLVHLRELSSEFAAQFPKVADKLQITELGCKDPFVERLLEGTAFLAARVEKKFDDGYAQFIQALLGRTCPLFTVPRPCFTIAKVNERLPGVVRAGPQDRFRTPSSTRTEIIMSPLFEVLLSNLRISGASCGSAVVDELPPHELAAHGFTRGLALDLSTDHGSLATAMSEALDVFLNIGNSVVSRLTQALEAELGGVYLKHDGIIDKLSGVTVSTRIVDDGQNLFSEVLHFLPGICCLDLFLTYPMAFHFVRIKGLREAMARLGEFSSATLIFAFTSKFELERTLRADHFLLNCVPLINLFPRRTDRMRITHHFENLLEVDNTAPNDYEIFAVTGLEIYNKLNREVFQADSFYSFKKNGGLPQISFLPRREQRLRGLCRTRGRYLKTNVMISFAGDGYSSISDQIAEFSGKVWCSNADLPEELPLGNTLTCEQKKLSVRILTLPSRVVPPPVIAGMEDEFKQLSSVLLNVSALFDQQPEHSLAAIKYLIRNLMVGTEEERDMLAQSLAELRNEPEIFRFVNHGAVYFERGYRVEMVLDDQKLAGVGVFNFGQVLRRLLSSYNELNLLIKFVLSSVQGGTIATFSPDPGLG